MKKKKIILNWSPPASINIPSPAHSILKSWLEKHNYTVSVLYWNLYFHIQQAEFLFYDLSLSSAEDNKMCLYLNYIAFESKDTFLYNNVKSIIQGHNPTYLSKDPQYYDRHMKSAYEKMDRTIDNILSTIDFSNILYFGFSLKMDQWIFASIIAKKIKKDYPSIPIVVGGINLKDNALSFLNNFPQFDFAIWGEGEFPLLELSDYLASNSNMEISSISNLAYKNDGKILFTNRNNMKYLNLEGSIYLPEFKDYFETKKELNIEDESYIPIEGSRGCHWNRCHFCYLNTDYKYRLKSFNNIYYEITHMIKTYNINKFEFLDNDLIGKDIARFHELLNVFIKIKTEYPEFQIIIAEIITKDLNHATIKKMFVSGISYAQIGYESPSSTLLKKIDKKNTFSSNLLYVKYARYYNITLGAVNILTTMPEETSEDIIEATNNLRYLRFFLDNNNFHHALIPLCVNSSSKYFKNINPEDGWEILRLPHIFLGHTFSKGDQWKILEFAKHSQNILWSSFKQIERYYLNYKHTYKIENFDHKITFKEYIKNKEILTFDIHKNSIEMEILQKANDSVISFELLYSQLSEQPKHTELKNKLTLLKEKGIIYCDDDFNNIISIIYLDNEY